MPARKVLRRGSAKSRTKRDVGHIRGRFAW